MALNLSRNSRVFFTTNVESTGAVKSTGFAAANTYEIQVLDGFTFSQNTNADVVTVSEAGVAPVRGQRSFNTSLAPVDFSMSTYIRPFNKSASSTITAEESVLWNALLSDKEIGATSSVITLAGTTITAAYGFASGVGTITIAGTSLVATGLVAGDVVVISGLTGTSDLELVNAPAKVVSVSASAIVLSLVTPKANGADITGITVGTVKFHKTAWAPVSSSYSLVSTAGSDLNQLQKFGMIFVVDTVVYVVDNCAMGQVTIDFGLDGIATAAWTGQGTTLKESTLSVATIASSATPKNTAATFITNKLSTVAMKLTNAIGNGTAGQSYDVALTGGSITINNNINYITPANLATVNVPTTYYTGTRSITGSMNAYLKTGSGVKSTGQLLSDLLSGITTAAAIEPMFSLELAIGGASNATKVVLDMPAVTISVPTVDVQQVVSTTINFTAQGYTPSATAGASSFALDKPSDLTVRYYAA